MKLNLRSNVSKKAAIVTIAAASSVFIGAGSAIAFVEFKGNAEGNATQTSALSATVVTTVPNSVLPGGGPENVLVKITNNGNVKIQVRTVALTVVSATKSAANGGGAVSAPSLATISVGSPATSTSVLNKANPAGSDDEVTRTGTITIEDSDTVDQTDLVGATIVVKASVNGG